MLHGRGLDACCVHMVPRVVGSNAFLPPEMESCRLLPAVPSTYSTTSIFIIIFKVEKAFQSAGQPGISDYQSLKSRSPWPVYVAREIAAAGGEFDKSVPEQGGEADKQTNTSSAPAYMLCLCRLLFPPFSAWKNGFNKKNVTWKCPFPSPI